MEMTNEKIFTIKGKFRVFEPGMIITPDTAVYIAENTEDVEPKYWNIGIRIEDDALVTETGCEILSSDIPKTVEEIERCESLKNSLDI